MYIYVYIYIYWRAEASLPCLLNYPNFRYIYIYIYLFIYIFQAVRRARAVNALRANVGPAGWGSMVNIIALKTATLVLSCS